MNISRENGRRGVMPIGVFIHGRDMGSVVQDMQERVSRLQLPPGYTCRGAENSRISSAPCGGWRVIVPISVFLIFVLLFQHFGSVRHALLVLLNVPFALIGGILALYVTRHSAERFGGDRLHRALRAIRAQWRGDDFSVFNHLRAGGVAAGGGRVCRARSFACARC